MRFFVATLLRTAESGLDEARQAKAREYAKLRRRLSMLDFALSAIVIIALAFTSLSSTVANTVALPEPLKAAAFFIAIMLAYSVVTLPLDYYRGFILSRRYGLSNQSLGSWFSDVSKSLTLSIVLGGVAIIVAYWLIGEFGGANSVAAGLGAGHYVSLVVSVLAPVLVITFFPMKPFPQNELRTRLEKLVARAGCRVRHLSHRVRRQDECRRTLPSWGRGGRGDRAVGHSDAAVLARRNRTYHVARRSDIRSTATCSAWSACRRRCCWRDSPWRRQRMVSW